jgi:hypothetical protein
MKLRCGVRQRADGTDSIAALVADEDHWPEMRVLICVVSSGPKDVSSTSGMQQSVDTSDLLKVRTLPRIMFVCHFVWTVLICALDCAVIFIIIIIVITSIGQHRWYQHAWNA